jgi:hypothetical protein
MSRHETHNCMRRRTSMQGRIFACGPKFFLKGGVGLAACVSGGRAQQAGWAWASGRLSARHGVNLVTFKISLFLKCEMHIYFWTDEVQ